MLTVTYTRAHTRIVIGIERYSYVYVQYTHLRTCGRLRDEGQPRTTTGPQSCVGYSEKTS
jgi:hypothetical protein